MKNINMPGKNSCTGCCACSNVCPHDAIEMKVSEKGFLAPFVDMNKCTSCGLCTKVCYKYYEEEKDNSIHISKCNYWAGWSNDKKVRYNSSSGGVTHEVLKLALKEGYKIIGCAYIEESNMTEHIIIDKEEDLLKIQGSKYIQSDFSKIKNKINFNEKYVVVGSPCQIFGIKDMVSLRKKEDNFIFIDFFCHGVPSYNIWNQYRDYLKNNDIKNIDKINFRYKEKSWSDYSMYIKSDSKTYINNKKNDPFLTLFLCNSTLNEACYSCKLRFNKLKSDIRMGDFWGEEYESNKDGVSLIIASSDLGKKLISRLSKNVHLEEKNFESIKKSQYHGETLYIPEYKDDINRMIQDNVGLEKIMKKYFDNSFVGKVKRKLRKILKRRR